MEKKVLNIISVLTPANNTSQLPKRWKTANGKQPFVIYYQPENQAEETFNQQEAYSSNLSDTLYRLIDLEEVPEEVVVLADANTCCAELQQCIATDPELLSTFDIRSVSLAAKADEVIKLAETDASFTTKLHWSNQLLLENAEALTAESLEQIRTTVGYINPFCKVEALGSELPDTPAMNAAGIVKTLDHIADDMEFHYGQNSSYALSLDSKIPVERLKQNLCDLLNFRQDKKIRIVGRYSNGEKGWVFFNLIRQLVIFPVEGNFESKMVFMGKNIDKQGLIEELYTQNDEKVTAEIARLVGEGIAAAQLQANNSLS